MKKFIFGIFFVRHTKRQRFQNTTMQKIDTKDVLWHDKYLRIIINPFSLSLEKRLLGTVIMIEDVTEDTLLNRSRDEFFSIASHELRTPLTAIRGNASLIQQYYAKKIPDETFQQMIRDIHDSSIRLIHIVNDFLDTSRLEQGRITFKKEPVDLLSLIEMVVKEYQGALEGQDVSLRVAPYHPDNTSSSSAHCLVLADVDRVKQVLINLIGNSVKYTKKGTIEVELDCTEKAFVKVLVTDTGSGISEKNQALLFKKFQQTEENLYTRDTTGGTGLGLYVAKLLVEGMGGTLQLEKSEVGKGSMFSFTLPTS